MVSSPNAVPPVPPPFVPAAPPAPPVAGPADLRPRRWLAWTVLTVGLVAVLLSFVPLLATPSADDYPVVAVPGQRSMSLTAGRTYTLYYEYPGARDEERPPPPVHVTGPTGEAEPMTPVPGATTYETITGGRQGRAFAALHPTLDGVYRIEVGPDPGGRTGEDLRVTIAEAESDAPYVAFLLIALVGVALVASGIALLVVRSVRRRRGTVPPTAVAPAPPGPPDTSGWAPPEPSAREPD